MLAVGVFSTQMLWGGSEGVIGQGSVPLSPQEIPHGVLPSSGDQAILAKQGLFFYRVPPSGEPVGPCELCELPIQPAHYLSQVIAEDKIHMFHTRCIKQWAEDNNCLSLAIDDTQHLRIEHREGKMVVRVEADQQPMPAARRTGNKRISNLVLPTWIIIARLAVLAAAGYLFSLGTVVLPIGEGSP